MRWLCFSLVLLCLSCSAPKVETAPFGTLQNGQEAKLFKLTNSKGATVELTDYGTRILSITVPDKNGVMSDVILGHDTLSEYEANRGSYFCGTIGRYANRLLDGKFAIDGVEYQLPINEVRDGCGIHIHGGKEGFDCKIWESEIIGNNCVRFSRVSPAGEEGYPGTLHCSATFIWDNSNTLTISYEATTDAPTIINLTNHLYVNLQGEDFGNSMNHQMQINSSEWVRSNKYLVPESIESVEGTPCDYRQLKQLGSELNGSSINWNIDGYDGTTLREACRVKDPASGRELIISSTEPALLVYTCSGLRGTGKGGKSFQAYGALVLEPHHLPNSPQNPSFPTCTLRPGEVFTSVSTYQFLAE